jgi:hypothetical protein
VTQIYTLAAARLRARHDSRRYCRQGSHARASPARGDTGPPDAVLLHSRGVFCFGTGPGLGLWHLGGAPRGKDADQVFGGLSRHQALQGSARTEAMYTTLLMSSGLTFGSISALFGLSHGIINQVQYSYLIAAVIGSAIVPTLIANAFFCRAICCRAIRPAPPRAHWRSSDSLPSSRGFVIKTTVFATIASLPRRL